MDRFGGRLGSDLPPHIGPLCEVISGRLDLPPPFGSGLYAAFPAAPLKEEVKELWPGGNAMRALMRY